MAVFDPVIVGRPEWVRQRVRRQGFATAISILRAEATTATTAGDTGSAGLLGGYANALSAAPADKVAFAIGAGRIGLDFIGA